MNKLDDKVIVRKSHFAELCAMLNPLNQEQDRVANKAMRLLAQNNTGWVAVLVNPTMEQAHAGRNARLSTYVHPMMDASVSDKISYAAMLKASPPLQGGGE